MTCGPDTLLTGGQSNRTWSVMGDTGKPNGEPGLTPGNAPRSRWRKKGQAGADGGGAERDLCPALADLYRTHYRSLIRLAALLTGDTAAAEAVVVDSFVALERTRKGLRSVTLKR